MDFLGTVNANLDLEKQVLRLKSMGTLIKGQLNQALREAGRNANRFALTVFAASNGHESGRESKQKFRNCGYRPREESR